MQHTSPECYGIKMNNIVFADSTEAILIGMFGLPQQDNHVKRYRWWQMTGC